MRKTRHINSVGNSGFTIVETLVAVTILMIAIAGPLVVASKSLTTAKLSKNQLVATYLASESIEAIKNLRDNNVDASGPTAWITGVYGDISSCKKAAPCDASAIDAIQFATNCPADGCSLYYSDKGYGHTSTGGTISNFRRKFFLHNPANDVGIGECQNGEECGATVEVFWEEGVNTYNIRITADITSTIR